MGYHWLAHELSGLCHSGGVTQFPGWLGTCLGPKSSAPLSLSQPPLSLPSSQMSCQGGKGGDNAGNPRPSLLRSWRSKESPQTSGSDFLWGTVSDGLCQFYCILRNSPHSLQKGVQRRKTGLWKWVWWFHLASLTSGLCDRSGVQASEASVVILGMNFLEGGVPRAISWYCGKRKWTLGSELTTMKHSSTELWPINILNILTFLMYLALCFYT